MPNIVHLRFRLRTLLVLTAIIAAACYWWIARPTIMAQRFIAAVELGNLAELETLWVGNRDKPLGIDYLARLMTRPVNSGWEWRLSPRTWKDVRRGVRRIEVQFRSSDSNELLQGLFEQYPPLIATPWGIDRDPTFTLPVGDRYAL